MSEKVGDDVKQNALKDIVRELHEGSDIEKVRNEMAKEGLDVLIAASVINVCYCTGHFSKIWASLRDHLRLAVIPKDSDPFVTCPDVEAGSFSKSGIFRVFEYPVGMDAGGVGEGVSADAGLVYRYLHAEGVAGELGKLV